VIRGSVTANDDAVSILSMHFYKDCAFALSALKIVDATCDLAEALSLVSMVRLKYVFIK